MRVLGLLKPGFTLAQARSDLDTIMQRLAQADPGPESDHRAYAEFLTEQRTGDLAHVFILLMASVCLVLVLACANIGGLLLIRMTTRAREMAIRTAIGAGRRRLARQLLTETVLITLLGGAVGILLAGFGLRAIEVLGPRDIPRLSEASLNLPVLIFAAALTLAVALVCSLVPLVSSDKVNLTILLKEEQHRLGHQLDWAHSAWRPCHRGDRGGCHLALYFGDSAAELVGRRNPESRIRAQPLARTRTAIAAFAVQKRGGHSRLLRRASKQRFARSRESNRSAQ